MTQMMRRAMENGLVFVEDATGGQLACPITDEPIQHTSSHVSVACLHEAEGETELILGSAADVSPSLEPVFDGMLDTPSREIMVSSVENDRLLTAKVPETRTRLRIWLSNPRRADRVIVGWG